MDIPQGFKPLFRSSPFLDLLGPFYYRENAEGFTVGIRVEEKHTNARGLAHGGLFMALADIALGYSAAFSKDPPLKLVTTTMTTDFRSEEHTSELQSLMRISYAVFCLKKKNKQHNIHHLPI